MHSSFHTAVQIDYGRWAVTFICQFGLLSETRIMSAAEFVEVIAAEAQRDGEDENLINDRERLH